MFAGSGIERGMQIQAPYDSLSFVPTILQLLDIKPKGGELPGPKIRELMK